MLTKPMDLPSWSNPRQVIIATWIFVISLSNVSPSEQCVESSPSRMCITTYDVKTTWGNASFLSSTDVQLNRPWMEERFATPGAGDLILMLLSSKWTDGKPRCMSQIKHPTWYNTHQCKVDTKMVTCRFSLSLHSSLYGIHPDHRCPRPMFKLWADPSVSLCALSLSRSS